VAVPPMSTLPEYCAILTVPVSSTSILGIPEMSLTLKIVPVKLFVIENNCPALPSKLNVPLLVGYTLANIFCGPTLASAPEKVIVGSPVLEPMFGVIKIFLSLFAIVGSQLMLYLLDSESAAHGTKVLEDFTGC
jgi:hypothetical protein